MKKLITLLFVLTGAFLYSQTGSTNSTCATALPFCAGGVSGITFPAVTGVTSAQTGPNYGCLGSTPNPAWYYLQISTSGNLDILIQGQTPGPPPGPGQDVDFICWGPFTNLASACNSLTSGNTVDCSYSSSFTETLNIPAGVAGEYYMVLITNFANVQQNIVFTQFGGTGSTNCALVSSNSQICAGSNGTVVATNSGSLTNPTYSITPGGAANSTGTFIVTPTITTTYTVYVIGVNGQSLATTQTAVSTVSVFPQPAAAPTVTNSTCTNSLSSFNLHQSFFPASPAPGYTVVWAPIPSGITPTNQVAVNGVNIPPGTYNSTITADGGCSVTTSFSIAPIPAPANTVMVPLGSSFTLTCNQPSIVLSMADPSNNYFWSNGLVAPVNTYSAVMTNTMTGTWTVNATNPLSNCTAQRTFTIGINMTAPSATVSPLTQNITCTLNSITTITATANPTVNISHQILAPQGGTFSSTSDPMIYTPGGIGTFTHCVVNDVNGCSTCSTFSVTSNQGFPTFSVVSPQSFTLGCNTKSVATINIINAATTPTAGGPVSYTLIGPPTGSTTQSGTLSSQSTYTVDVPGTWTVVTMDNTNQCQTRLPISVLSNTFEPNISAVVPQQTLNCETPKTKLKGQSLTTNVNYLWSFPGSPGTQPGDTIAISANTLQPNNQVIANFTLTITDNNNTCKSFSVIPMYQNVYPPHALITNGGTSSLTCVTHTISLTNVSSSGIPPNTFPGGAPVIGYIWDGPTPQPQGQLQTTYIAATIGTYTLTAKDLNNGCTSTATLYIGDNRIYPVINTPVAAGPFTLDCGDDKLKIYTTISNLSPSMTYTWLSAPGTSLTGQDSGTLTVNNPGEYKVLVTNSANGCASSALVKVSNGRLFADFEADVITGYAPLTVNFTNKSTSSSTVTGTRNITSIWNFGNGSTKTFTSAETATALYTQPGTYEVTLYTQKGSCIESKQSYIKVEIPSGLEIPNVFTPNGDGVNDLYFLHAKNLAEITLLIYDRWGHIIYELTSTTGNIEWDGKNQAGKEVAEGTYFYILKTKGKDGVVLDKHGSISLYR
jgi:gliding motility-associated-like protein